MPLGTEVGLCPGHIVFDGDPATPKGVHPPNFRSMSVVAKRLPISATAEHLLCNVSDVKVVAAHLSGVWWWMKKGSQATGSVWFHSVPSGRGPAYSGPMRRGLL